MRHERWSWVACWRKWLRTACPLCLADARGGEVCAPCALTLQQARAVLPALHLPGLTQVCAALAYQAPADVLIWQFKHQGRLGHARLLGGWMQQALSAQAALPADAVLVPVPASRRSLQRRGFNPARELARDLARRLGRHEAPGWLRRRETPFKQAELGARARREILDGVFFCPQSLPARPVLLVDDVVTTGSTAMAAAAALRAAGCPCVSLAVAAQVPRRPG